MTFQRVSTPRSPSTSTNTPSSTINVLPHHGMLWYGSLDLGVLVGGLVPLPRGALVVFGRLEGNFAEEL